MDRELGCPRTEIQTISMAGIISMEREMGSPRTEIQRDIISMDKFYLHEQKDGIPTDRNTDTHNLHGQVLSPRTERWDPHGQK